MRDPSPADAPRPALRRLPLLALAMLALAAATWGGLLRGAWGLPLPRESWVVLHGPLMVSGFLGTLIGLERAVALGRWWAWIGPVLTGLGALAVMAGLPGKAGPALLTAGSAALALVAAGVVGRQAAMHHFTMALGALAWLIGNALWLIGRPVHLVVLWWAGFLVLTIMGERLELSRVLRPSAWGRLGFRLALALLIAGLALSVPGPEGGLRLTALGLVALAAWLARYDVARHTVRQSGLTRYMAVCLLSGYAWLGLAGLYALWAVPVTPGLAYDAFLHMIFLGFVFAMIFAHAPVIFPAVLGVRMLYRPAFYGHLALLHASLLLRVGADLAGWVDGRRWGALLNALALLLFLVNTVRSVRRPHLAGPGD